MTALRDLARLLWGGRQAVEADDESREAWDCYLAVLKANGLPVPGAARDPKRKPAMLEDEQALYDVTASFADLLPWVEYLPGSKCLLLEDGESVAAFFELTPIGTEGRETRWLWQGCGSLENAIQDSFDAIHEPPWVGQLHAPDGTCWGGPLNEILTVFKP